MSISVNSVRVPGCSASAAGHPMIPKANAQLSGSVSPAHKERGKRRGH
jgi:hypothetical protein